MRKVAAGEDGRFSVLPTSLFIFSAAVGWGRECVCEKTGVDFVLSPGTSLSVSTLRVLIFVAAVETGRE
jgi:hypothetical protein